LKKRTKKLLLASMRADRIGRINQESKSFLFLFFKKEILPCFAGVSLSMKARSHDEAVERIFAFVEAGIGMMRFGTHARQAHLSPACQCAGLLAELPCSPAGGKTLWPPHVATATVTAC
jgi:hypothetical protein